ncbi:hypothetical protein [Paraburkholderia phosphatilytica]|uniref:hypothetical protein n=1 Tax=Paraburkholderia phosphatilytica TaxID=2282883 RepID=UPI000E52A85F|nr:hypothetical protein [Paraburkholderia phosphatilytica]
MKRLNVIRFIAHCAFWLALSVLFKPSFGVLAALYVLYSIRTYCLTRQIDDAEKAAARLLGGRMESYATGWRSGLEAGRMERREADFEAGKRHGLMVNAKRLSMLRAYMACYLGTTPEMVDKALGTAV